MHELVLAALRARFNISKRTMLDASKYSRDDLRALEEILVKSINESEEKKAEDKYFKSIVEAENANSES